MEGRAWSWPIHLYGGARVSFAESGELAGLDIDARLVERQAEALGREIADDERQVVEPDPATARTLYLGLDGTGVPVRKAETRDRRGKQPDGSAKTCEAKILAVWSADTLDRDGRPVRDPGSVTYSAAIETIASRDSDPDPSAFAGRARGEASIIETPDLVSDSAGCDTSVLAADGRVGCRASATRGLCLARLSRIVVARARPSLAHTPREPDGKREPTEGAGAVLPRR